MLSLLFILRYNIWWNAFTSDCCKYNQILVHAILFITHRETQSHTSTQAQSHLTCTNGLPAFCPNEIVQENSILCA